MYDVKREALARKTRRIPLSLDTSSCAGTVDASSESSGSAAGKHATAKQPETRYQFDGRGV